MASDLGLGTWPTTLVVKRKSETDEWSLETKEPRQRELYLVACAVVGDHSNIPTLHLPRTAIIEWRT